MNKKQTATAAKIIAEAYYTTNFVILPEELDELRKNTIFNHEFEEWLGWFKKQDILEAEYDRKMTEEFGADWAVQKVAKSITPVSCPECSSYNTNSVTPVDDEGYQEYKCQDCGHYFVEEALARGKK